MATTHMTNNHDTANILMKGCWYSYNGLDQRTPLRRQKKIALHDIQFIYLVKIEDDSDN